MKKMKTKILALLSIVILSSSCSDDNDPVATTPPVTSNELSGNISSDVTLDASIEYVLNGALFVKDGATLTIPAGTTIKAIAGGTDIYVLVERGGKIMANGTATNPIRFTSLSLAPQAGDWGGIIINGRSTISKQPGSLGEAATEINNAILFGGSSVNDNSGILNHVIIEYTGARIDDESEHNGLTLNAVGSGTTISNIYLRYSDDDAIEFFGGTVNVSNILVVNCTDDMFDFSQGYSGTVTNVYGIREDLYFAVTVDPRGVEADGNLDGNSPTDIQQSDFTINGITIVNNAGGGTATMQDVFKIRRGAKAKITNAYVKFGAGTTPIDLVDLKDGKGDAHEMTSIEFSRNAANGLDAAAIKNTTQGGATIVENSTQLGSNTNVFVWTGYAF